jgi:hypothetical protein
MGENMAADVETTQNRIESRLQEKEESEQQQATTPTLISSLHCPILTSYHSDNWLFYDKRRLLSSKTTTATENSPTSHRRAGNLDRDFSSPSFVSEKNSCFTTSVVANLNHNKTSDMYFFHMKSGGDLNSSSLEQNSFAYNKLHRAMHPTTNAEEEEICCSSSSSSLCCKPEQWSERPADALNETKKQQLNLTITICENNELGVSKDSAEAASMLTSSSCHSERSQVNLNCFVCSATDDSSSGSLLLDGEVAKQVEVVVPKTAKKHCHVQSTSSQSQVDLESKQHAGGCSKYISTLKIEINCPVIKYVSSPIIKEDMKCIKIFEQQPLPPQSPLVPELSLADKEDSLSDGSTVTLKSAAWCESINQISHSGENDNNNHQGEASIVKSFVVCDCDGKAFRTEMTRDENEIANEEEKEEVVVEKSKEIIEELLCSMVGEIELTADRMDQPNPPANETSSKENSEFEFITSIIDTIFDDIDYNILDDKKQPEGKEPPGTSPPAKINEIKVKKSSSKSKHRKFDKKSKFIIKFNFLSLTF